MQAVHWVALLCRAVLLARFARSYGYPRGHSHVPQGTLPSSLITRKENTMFEHMIVEALHSPHLVDVGMLLIASLLIPMSVTLFVFCTLPHSSFRRSTHGPHCN